MPRYGRETAQQVSKWTALGYPRDIFSFHPNRRRFRINKKQSCEPSVNLQRDKARREAKKRAKEFHIDAECALKQLRRHMKESGPDKISDAQDKAFKLCRKHVSQKLLKEGVHDPDDALAKRRALKWIMDRTSSG